MGDIGLVAPGYHQIDKATIWRVPLQVWLTPKGEQLKVISVYEDEGFLCIDVELPTEPEE